MNFKVSYLAALIGGALSVNAFAASDDAANVHQIIPGKEKVKLAHANKVRNDSMYYVVLKDKSLSDYNGGLLNYAATSIKTVNAKSSNKTAKGLLNVNSAASKSYSAYLQQKQDSFISSASKILKRQVKAKHSYKIVLNAMAVELTSSEASVLAKQADVERVEKIGLHYISSDTGPEFIGAKSVWSGVGEHIGTQGEGVVMGIFDTGINATHPSFADIGGDGYDHSNPFGEGNYLGDCLVLDKFCNDKLIGIISYPELLALREDIVDDQYDDIAEKVTIGYDFQGHGTHVASTAAGNIVKDVSYYLSVTDDEGTITGESDFAFEQISGVAPHANIVAYQVCGDTGSCYPELTVRAIEHAIENGIQVINYSVGGSAVDPWESTDASAFLNARNAGLHVAVAAGNSGPDASTLGAPGNSPWVTTVAAYSHNRSFSDVSLDSFSGGESQPTSAIVGKGATQAFTGKVVRAEDYGDAQCLTPFAENTFAGEIVVCERGSIARVRKGLNVKEGGAGGLILMNVSADANSLHADSHLLPAINIDMESGESLTAWLASGADHTATISASELVKDDSLGDIAGWFTSRGPNAPYLNIFSPDIAAPGVSVYAAFAEDKPFSVEENGVPYSTLDGTSMASPHVAGALALVHATHPDWTPAEVQAAIMSTASQLTYKDDDGDGITERSNFFDQGAGSIRVNKAINAGLLLDISNQAYADASPSEGGDPATLNTTSVVQQNCTASCSWTRTVEAVKDSSWTASFEYLNAGFAMEVSPASFSLKAGETQELTITATANIELVDEWVHGYINLENADESMSDTHLQATIAFTAGDVIDEVTAEINNVNDSITITDIVTSGSTDLQAKGFGFYKASVFSGTAIGSAEGLEQDSPGLYQDNLYTQLLTVKPYTKRVIVEVTETTSPDVDLYVGIDTDGDGLPSLSEVYNSLVCLSGNFDSEERCVIETPTAGNYWIFAHNYTGTEVGQPDDVTLEIAQIAYTEAASFDIDAPTEVAQGEAFDVEMSINGYLDGSELSALAEGESYYGLLELGSSTIFKRNIGATLMRSRAQPMKSLIPRRQLMKKSLILNCN